MSERIEELLERCETLHGHLCAGQVLGVRMALLGCALIGINDPEGNDRKKLIIWVEIDRCMADAVAAVTGVRLGKRTLKYFDYGKVAATFYNTETERAVRVAALDGSRETADRLLPRIESRRERQLLAYQTMKPEDLFKLEFVDVRYHRMDAPGRTLSRVICSGCGEGINDGREILISADDVRCRSCVYGGYYVTQMTGEHPAVGPITSKGESVFHRKDRTTIISDRSGDDLAGS